MLYLIDDGAAPTGLTHNIKHMCYKDHAPLELRNSSQSNGSEKVIGGLLATIAPNAIMLGLRGNTLCFIAELLGTDSCACPVGTKAL